MTSWLRLDVSPEPRYPLFALGVLGAAIGALFATLVAQPYANPDSHAFEAIARSLLSGRGLTYEEPMLPGLTLYAYRSPGFPLFAAPLLALGGMPLVLVVQGALAGLTAALVGALAARFANRNAGILAFLIAMAWWPTWEFAGQFMSETLFTTLSVLAVAMALEARDRGAGAAVVSGLLVASATLTRSIGFALAAAIGLWLFRSRPRLAAVFALAALLAWAPWPIRNAVHLNAFVPLTTNAAMNFYTGNSGVAPDVSWREMAANVNRGELGFEEMFAERTRQEVMSDPALLARRIADKAVRYAVPRTRELGTWLHLLLLPAILVGVALSPGVRAGLALPGAVWAASGVVNAVSVTNTRYRMPTDWVVVLAAGLSIAALAAPASRRELAEHFRRLVWRDARAAHRMKNDAA